MTNRELTRRQFIWADKTVLAADGWDIAFIQAHVVDSKGVLVPMAHPWISFSVDGPGRLLGGTTEIDAISGIAAINLQSAGKRGHILIRAEAHGLNPASIELAASSGASSGE